MTIVPVKDVPVGLSPHLRGRADFFIEVRHFGTAYYIPLSRELKRAFNMHVVKGRPVVDFSRRGRDLEAILSDLVGSVFLQVRDTVGAEVKAQLSRQMEESFSVLFEKTISGAVDARLALPERRAVKIIKHDRFRSAGRGLDQDDDMVRVTVDMTAKEFNRFRTEAVEEEGLPRRRAIEGGQDVQRMPVG